MTEIFNVASPSYNFSIPEANFSVARVSEKRRFWQKTRFFTPTEKLGPRVLVGPRFVGFLEVKNVGFLVVKNSSNAWQNRRAILRFLCLAAQSSLYTYAMGSGAASTEHDALFWSLPLHYIRTIFTL